MEWDLTELQEGYISDKLRLLCRICGAPELHPHTHWQGFLHLSQEAIHATANIAAEKNPRKNPGLGQWRATTVDEALEVLRATRPDLLLPNIDGRQDDNANFLIEIDGDSTTLPRWKRNGSSEGTRRKTRIMKMAQRRGVRPTT